MKADEAEKILRAYLAEVSEPLRSAIDFALTNWAKISEGTDEEWRDVIGFDGHYQVSNLGRIKSFKWGVEKILKPNRGKGDYCRVSLYENGKLKKILVHVLVAKAFLPNPNNLPVVNHIDNVHSNNRVENLEWVTHSENQRHALQIGAKKLRRKASVVEIDTGTSRLHSRSPYICRFEIWRKSFGRKIRREFADNLQDSAQQILREINQCQKRMNYRSCTVYLSRIRNAVRLSQQKNELTCVILCAKVKLLRTHTARRSASQSISAILNVPACFVKHKGAFFYDRA